MITKTNHAQTVRSAFEAHVEKWYSDDDAPPFGPHLLKPLEGCDDILPAMHCEMLGLPIGSSYADAVELFAPSGTYELDLHGFSVSEAVELAEDMIRACWESGFSHIRIIHGAPDIRYWMETRYAGRGGIKWSLRGCLHRGEWSKYVFPRRSSRHLIDDGYMTLALRPQ